MPSKELVLNKPTFAISKLRFLWKEHCPGTRGILSLFCPPDGVTLTSLTSGLCYGAELYLP